MRAAPWLSLVLALTSCGWLEGEREKAAEAARAAALAEVERALSQTFQLADGLAGAADRILEPMPVMPPSLEDELRRHLNGVHLARARALGVRAASRGVLDSLVAAGALVPLEDSTRYWIVRERTSPAYVVPHVPRLLEILGDRFQARLAELGLPPYRIEVTSATRTSARQARLRRTNDNAAAASSHEYGTTVDLSYAAFAPPAERPTGALPELPEAYAEHLERIIDLALESVSARKSRELGAVFSSVLAEVQEEGLAVVIYERQQTVYHVTVAKPLADEPHEPAAPRPAQSAGTLSEVRATGSMGSGEAGSIAPGEAGSRP
ncbi:MAG TPA: DUF5715 family protein [Longimicrobiales bacterium]|nr:DUF5715 family protein [Longimicrobiales bacterium]